MKSDPILEECYRIKEVYSAQFKDMQAFFSNLNKPKEVSNGRRSAKETGSCQKADD